MTILALTPDVLVDGSKLTVVQFGASFHTDTTGAESDAVKFDASAVVPIPTSANIKIMRIWYANTVPGTYLEFDGATDSIAVAIPQDSGYIDFRAFGGLQNNATTPTGDITLTTAATPAVGDAYSIVLEVSKS